MGNKLFIGGLSFKTTEQTIVNGFSVYGELRVVRLVLDHVTGRSRGFAFITYIDPESAAKAIEGLDNTEFDGRRIAVKYAIDKRAGSN